MTNLWNEDANRASSAYVRYDLQGHSHTGNTGVDNAPDRWASLCSAYRAHNITLYIEPTTQFVVNPKSVHLTLSSEFTLQLTFHTLLYTELRTLHFILTQHIYTWWQIHNFILHTGLAAWYIFILAHNCTCIVYISYWALNFTLHTKFTTEHCILSSLHISIYPLTLHFTLSSQLYTSYWALDYIYTYYTKMAKLHLILSSRNP